MENYFDDKELGRVIIKLNPRAKSYSVKIKNGEIYAVMPEYGSLEYMISIILKNKGKIKSILDSQPKHSVINENSVIKTASFQVTPMLSGFLMDKLGMTVLFPYAAIFVALALVTMRCVHHGDSKPLPKKGLEALNDPEDQ